MSQEDVAPEVCQDSVTEEETEARTGKWAGAHQAKRGTMLAKGPMSAENHRQGAGGQGGRRRDPALVQDEGEDAARLPAQGLVCVSQSRGRPGRGVGGVNLEGFVLGGHPVVPGGMDWSEAGLGRELRGR